MGKVPNFEKVALGLLNFTWNPDIKYTQDEFNQILKAAIDLSHNKLFLNAGEFYGVPDRHENIEKLGNFFKSYPAEADSVYISVKGGIDANWQPDTSVKMLESCLDAIDKHLAPLYNSRTVMPKRLDMFTLARMGDNPIEQTMHDLAEFGKSGRFSSLCLSEVIADTLRKANEIYPVDAVEIEFSPWCLEPLNNGLFEECVALNIPVLAYSPLGKGLLAGLKPESLTKNDGRRNFDWFKEENYRRNQVLIAKIDKLAAEHHMSKGQFLLSWMTTLSASEFNGREYPRIVPIPGSTNKRHIMENMDVKQLDHQTLEKVFDAARSQPVQGYRYNAESEAFLNK